MSNVCLFKNPDHNYHLIRITMIIKLIKVRLYITSTALLNPSMYDNILSPPSVFWRTWCSRGVNNDRNNITIFYRMIYQACLSLLAFNDELFKLLYMTFLNIYIKRAYFRIFEIGCCDTNYFYYFCFSNESSLLTVFFSKT